MKSSGWSSRPPATAANAVPLGQRSSLGGSEDEKGGDVVPNLINVPGLGSLAFLTQAPLETASKHARKVYIGNLPPSATSEQLIAQFFNQTLAALLPNKPPGDSIVGTYLNVQKRFAFVENRSIEETTFTLGLDGIQMDGYALKLRRPQDYNAQLAQQQLANEMRQKGGISSLRGAWNPMTNQSAVPAQTSAIDLTGSGSVGIISTSVEDGPHKVFIGGLPHHMGEMEVKELLMSYGPLRAFHLVKDRDQDRSKGFAFCEWRDPNVTDIACQALNGLKLGDRFLNVRRALPHAATRAGLAAAVSNPMIGAGAGTSTDIVPSVGSYDTYMPVPEPPMPQQKGIPPIEVPAIAHFFKREIPTGSRCLAFRQILSSAKNPAKEPPAEQVAEGAAKDPMDVEGRDDREAKDRDGKGIDLTAEVDIEKIQQLVEEVKKQAARVGRVRNAVFHHTQGGSILVEFSLPEEALAAQKIFSDKEFPSGIRPICSLVDLVPEMRKACVARLCAEGDLLARMDNNARKLYLEKQAKQRAEQKERRDALLKMVSEGRMIPQIT